MHIGNLMCYTYLFQCRPVLHHCAYYFFLVLWNYVLYVVLVWKRSSAHALGALVVWYNITIGAIFPSMQAILTEDFIFVICFVQAYIMLFLCVHFIMVFYNLTFCFWSRKHHINWFFFTQWVIIILKIFRICLNNSYTNDFSCCVHW